jgi:translation initiation factor IF-3
MKKEYRVNNQIEDKIIDLVQEGKGIEKNVNIHDAINLSNELGLDLVEITPFKNGKNAICKILDYGKLKYKETKKHKSHKQVIKEIKFNINISEHDLGIKNKKVHEFLGKKYIVRYSMELKGYREKSLIEVAKNNMINYLKEFENKATWTPLNVSFGGSRVKILVVLSPLGRKVKI